MRAAVTVLLFVASAFAANLPAGRIAGGSLTTINAYPFSVSVLHAPTLVTYWQYCGGTIINNRSVLSAGHCFYQRGVNQYRIRYGSTYANSGGTVNTVSQIIINILYNPWSLDNDIAILRSGTNILFQPNLVAAAGIGGYNVADNVPLVAIGWGRVSYTGALSEQLRQVPIWSINQAICRTRYANVGWAITDNMICAGWLDVGTRGQCAQDEGSPLVQNYNTVVGIYAFSYQCGHYWYPSVNTRVSRYVTWIQANA